jgi:hypothetical protein
VEVEADQAMVMVLVVALAAVLLDIKITQPELAVLV